MAIAGLIGVGLGVLFRAGSTSVNSTDTTNTASSSTVDTKTTQLSANQIKLLTDIKVNVNYVVPTGFVAQNYYTLSDDEGGTSYLADLTEQSSGALIHINKDSASWVKQEIVTKDVLFVSSDNHDSYFADQYKLDLPSVQKPLAAMKYDSFVFEDKTFPVAWGRFEQQNLAKNDNPYLLGFALVEARGSTYIISTVARPAGGNIDDQVKAFQPTFDALLTGLSATK
jgi:hypothetical protein